MNHLPTPILILTTVALLFVGTVPLDAVAAALESKDASQSLPIEAQRTAVFTTDEGTWLSVDVSADGKTVVFDLVGQLYTVAIAGGEARPITSGMAFNTQPRFSPDGRKLAFISDRSGAENLWIAASDGSNARQLSKDEHSALSSPAWLPDGQLVLVSKKPTLPEGPFKLWAYHVNGGAGFAITKSKSSPEALSDQARPATGAVASPDGKYLYYTQRGARSVNFPLSQIVRRNRATGEEDTITAAPGSAFRPVVSPDGTRLVYGTRYETETALRLLDLRTGEERWLKYPVQRDDQESAFSGDLLPGYAFTPDGKELIVSYGGKIHRLDVASGRDRLIPFTAKVSRGLGPLLNFPARVEEGPVKWRILQGAVQSPDGKRLAFSAATRLYAMDIPRGTPRRLTKSNDREYQPTWSPDGRWIAYVTWSGTGGHVWKVRSDGSSAPVRLTQVPAYYREPAWSPDASRIVALRGPRQWQLAKLDEWSGATERLDLVSVAPDGGSVNLIAPAHGASMPHFVTEQKDRVYLYTPQGLISMRFDGTDRRTHLKIVMKAWDSDPTTEYLLSGQDAHISPDGRWVAARASNQLYLIPAPNFGGEPLTVDLTPFAAQAPDHPTSANAVDVATDAGPGTILPVRKLTRIGADSVAWAQDGSAITWNVGASFFRQPLAAVAAGYSAAEEIPVNLQFPRATPAGTVVLRGAKVVTLRGDEVIENADILVKDNRIVKVGQRDSFAVPPDAKTFDLGGSTIVPGFIDVHAHWMEIRRGVLDPENNWAFFANLAYGVTTGRDPQTMTSDTFAYQDLVDMGEIPGPRAYATGPGVFPYNDFQSLEDAKSVISRYKQYYGTKTVKSYMVGNRRQRQWVVQACNDLQIMPTTEGAGDLKLDLTHVIDGFSGNEHGVPITPLYKDVIQMLVQSKITYTPTLIVAYGGPTMENYFYETTDVHGDAKFRHFVPHEIIDARAKRRPSWFSREEYVFPRLAAADKKIIEAGGHIAVGAHGAVQGLGYHWEMWALSSGGLSNLEVLRSATLRGAEAIGYARDLGSIEEGKLADLVILAKDPLQDIHNTNTVRYVMKNGQLFDGDTLDQVWPSQKTLARSWWSNDGPVGSSERN
jgi:Tol biopolymer transport system component/imidazolonepropionase-like amidohydrolase